ncbi:MAG: D-2-hydroxyacid dehydrogenase [Desulfatitalea sp.]|nr:D-2-hydroxyacid dehydrogenase [Desulfatitalea sp.]
MPQALITFDLAAHFIARLGEQYPQLELVQCTDREQILHHLPRTEILLTFFLCTRRMLDAAPQLKWIQAISAGVDYMALDEIRRRGILLTNGRGIHRIHMAEFAIAAMINLARGFHTMFRNQLQKKWDRDVPQAEIYGATLGILGLGAIGGEIAAKAAMMGMRVIGVKRNPAPLADVETVYGPEQMDQVFQQSDYLINLLPSTPDTEKMVDRHLFNQMKPTACFINIGRGRTVNEPDLIEALQTRRIKAMVSDVYYEEPLPADSPLWDLDNVILAPHICGASPRYHERAMEIMDHNLAVYFTGRGEMINVVDLAAGY